MAEILLEMMQHYRLPDPNIHYEDVPPGSVVTPSQLDTLMQKYLEVGHQIDALLNRATQATETERDDS